MPVTAKLSQAFYERLGEQIANELVDWFNSVDATYRSDLKEINELNYARFDATVDKRLVALESRIQKTISDLKSDMLKWMFGFWVTTLFALVALR